ncbi:hypothetical protein [Jannaschia formosa]|uniref:hypothetical protein n=1 Tax=Jannaschia formosa TaxID=2259592 RepID=UPI000E1B6E3C|nr:hypothetical protein [Jannaschia formosa]TFL16402.1 hypothetical protein DR046_19970 [Jannaschia formosa]
MGPCRICAAPWSPYGYRLPGPLSARRRRGYVWACPDHRAEVEALQRQATRAAPAANPEDPQGSLL